MTIKILLVENDTMDQNAFKRFVTQENLPYRYTIADSVAATSRSLLEQNKFDVILIDYMLGDGTGFDVLELVPEVMPAIFITGTGSEEIAVEAMRSGASDYLIKDIERTYLKLLPVVIERTIRSTQKQREIQTLSHAVMSSNDSIFISDLDNKITFVNQQFCSTYGYLEKEVMGQQCNILYELTGNLPPTEEFTDFECTHLRQNGETFPVSMSRSLIRDDSGYAFARMVIAHDVSERKRAEAKLIESEARYRSVVTAMNEGVILQDRNGVITTSNLRAEEILGLSVDQMMGRTSTDPRWKAIREDGSPFTGEEHPSMVTLKTGEPQHNIIMGVHKPSSELTWISINSQPLIHQGDDNPFAVVATFSDITEFRNAQEEALDRAIEDERHAILSEFVQDALHEFRTPLSAIKTSTYLIGKTAEEPIIQRHTTSINTQIDAVSRLLDEMMLMWKLEHSYSINKQSFDVVAMLRTVIADTQANCEQMLELEAPTASLQVDGDSKLLERAYLNIVQNAIEHSAPASKIMTRVLIEQNKVTIEIVDHGTGMEVEEMKQALHPFYRGDEAHTTRGFGLGLTITKAILKLHGGDITVTSKPNKGTTVKMLLPQV